MELKYFFVTAAYILTTCDLVLGANTIINVTLVDGETPNEGRVEYRRSDATTWASACGEGVGSAEASVVCRQLGYPGANNYLAQWPFGDGTTVAQDRLNCDGNEENLADCSLASTTFCTNKGGVSCYESGYTGCYPYPASTMLALGDLQTPCENGLQDSTIPNCVSLCHDHNGSYTYAGLYQGNMCLCGKASTTIDQSTKEADRSCSTPCTGRTIETCGGANHIALFNITLYLKNTTWTANSSECAETTPTQTEGNETTTVSIQSSSISSPSVSSTDRTTMEGDETTTVRIQSSSTSSLPPSSSSSPSPSPSSPLPSMSLPSSPPSYSSPSSSPPSSPLPTSPLVPSTDRTAMEGAVSSTFVASSSSSDQTTGSTTAQTMTEGTPSMINVQTFQTSPVITSDVTPRSRTTTGTPARTTRGRTTQTEVPSSPGLYIGVGAGGGILLLIGILLLVVFIIRCRRSKDKGSSGDHNILELRLRPEGSDLGDFAPLPFSPNNYSLENGHTNMAADDLTVGTGVEDSDYAMITDTDMNQLNSARNGSTYEDVPRLESTSGSLRPPQPAPRKSTKDTQFVMHPVHELYTTPDESQLSNGHRDSIPEYAVSQKFRKEPISEAVPQAPPSALGPEDINGLYTMPDKSRNMTKAKKVLDSDMGRPAGIDNALYICRGEDDLQEGETPNEYATDKDGMGGEEEIDGDTGMVENDLYETSHGPTGGDTGMVENDLYETSHGPTSGDTGMVENDMYDTSYRPT